MGGGGGKIYTFPIGPATRCDEIGHFAAILRVLEASQPIADLSLKIARWNVLLFSWIFIAAMAHRNTSLRMMCLILHESPSDSHQNAENRLKNGITNSCIEHVELSIAAHRMRF